MPSLTGNWFLALVALLFVAAMLGVALTWNRWRPWFERVAAPRVPSDAKSRGRAPLVTAAVVTGRLASLLAVAVMGAALAGTLVNRAFDFYTSFADIVGHPAPLTVASLTPTRSLSAADRGLGEQNALAGRGTLVRWVFGGPASGVVRRGELYLPADYFTGGPRLRFPVIELFAGTPGSTHNWVRQLSIVTVLDREISAGRIPPVIAALVPYNDPGRDRECVNGSGPIEHQKDQTFVVNDVRSDLIRGLRVLPQSSAWATLGYSTGGFCAVNVALHHPDSYVAAASLSGYFTAFMDRHTGRLYGSPAQLTANSPIWWVRHRPVGGVNLFLAAADGDTASLTAIRDFQRAIGGRLPVTVEILRHGGHSFTTWAALLPTALDWIGGHLAGPLTPPLVPIGQSVGDLGHAPSPSPSSSPRPSPQQSAAAP